MPKRRRTRAFGSMLCTTKCIGLMYCNTPAPAARPIRVRPAWTRSGSRTSRRTEWTAGRTQGLHGRDERFGMDLRESLRRSQPLPALEIRSIRRRRTLFKCVHRRSDLPWKYADPLTKRCEELKTGSPGSAFALVQFLGGNDVTAAPGRASLCSGPIWYPSAITGHFSEFTAGFRRSMYCRGGHISDKIGRSG